jgi:hypothetical protein
MHCFLRERNLKSIQISGMSNDTFKTLLMWIWCHLLALCTCRLYCQRFGDTISAIGRSISIYRGPLSRSKPHINTERPLEPEIFYINYYYVFGPCYYLENQFHFCTFVCVLCNTNWGGVGEILCVHPPVWNSWASGWLFIKFHVLCRIWGSHRGG